MPQPKPLPTPTSSTDLAAVEKIDMEGAFTLPPPATPPVSPKDTPQRKRTISGATKPRDDDNELPPPPSRARKIIQMKPKSNSTSSASDYAPPKPTAGTKRKQPSSTSAAGRKIARKTAHSIIERRRRSKMNEEFGVLKDMIPACEGVEMHKLAILQAGIEYVRYLEGCIKQLKGQVVDDKEEEAPAKRSATASTTDWEYGKPSVAASISSGPSPDLIPQQPQHRPTLPSIPSFAGSPRSATPTPTLLSPAFAAIHFSPDLRRTNTSSTTATSISPNILPLPLAMLDRMQNKSPASECGAEATATAALMMMGNDRRGSKGKGMSVKDLLTS